MQWLNLEVSMLHAPEFIGSDPVSRSTWLSVLLWCVSQENGGRICGGLNWKDRQWQQTCGVTLEEITNSKFLLRIEGDDLLVWNYPHKQQEALNRQRSAGKLGSQRRWSSTPKEEFKEQEFKLEEQQSENQVAARPNFDSALRIAKLFGRRATTPWNDREKSTFKKLGEIDPGDLELIEEYYQAERSKGDKGWHRRNLATFLNNFQGEVDRAKAWKQKAPMLIEVSPLTKQQIRMV